MSLLYIFLTLVAVGVFAFLVWLLLKVPMTAPFKQVIQWVAIAAVVIWLLYRFHVLSYLAAVKI